MATERELLIKHCEGMKSVVECLLQDGVCSFGAIEMIIHETSGDAFEEELGSAYWLAVIAGKTLEKRARHILKQLDTIIEDGPCLH